MKGGKCSFEHDPAKKKGRAKEVDQEAQLNETLPQKQDMPERQGKVVSGKENRPACFNYKVDEIAVMIESVIIGILLRVGNIFKKYECKVGKECPVIRPQEGERSTSPQRKEKGKATDSDKKKSNGCNCEFCKSPSKDNRNTHQKVKKNLEQMEQNTKKHSCAQTETPVGKISIRFSRQSLERAEHQRQISISEWDPDWQQKREMSKCTTVRPKVYRVE